MTRPRKRATRSDHAAWSPAPAAATISFSSLRRRSTSRVSRYVRVWWRMSRRTDGTVDAGLGVLDAEALADEQGGEVDHGASPRWEFAVDGDQPTLWRARRRPQAIWGAVRPSFDGYATRPASASRSSRTISRRPARGGVGRTPPPPPARDARGRPPPPPPPPARRGGGRGRARQLLLRDR